MDPDSYLCRLADLFDGVVVTPPSIGAIIAIVLAVAYLDKIVSPIVLVFCLLFFVFQLFNSAKEQKNSPKDSKIMIKELQKRCKEQLEIELTVTGNAKVYIVEKSFDRKYGARPLKRKIQEEIEDRLAEAIIAGNIKKTDNTTGCANTGNLIATQNVGGIIGSINNGATIIKINNPYEAS